MAKAVHHERKIITGNGKSRVRVFGETFGAGVKIKGETYPVAASFEIGSFVPSGDWPETQEAGIEVEGRLQVSN